MQALTKMPGHPRLYRRGAVYYHRASVPTDIADTYPKVEEKFSLRTKDYQEALRLVRIAAVEVDQRFADHRNRIQRPVQKELTQEQLRLIHDEYYRHLLEEDEETRLNGFEGYTAAKSFEDAEALNQDLATVTRNQYARGELDSFFRSEAEEVLTWESIDIKLDPRSSCWRRVVRTLQEANLKAADSIARRFKGEIIETPAQAQKQTAAPAAGQLLSVLFNQRREEALLAGNWSAKLDDDYVEWTTLFIEVAGDRPIHEYKKSDARDFKNLLMELPSNRKTRPQTKGLTTQQTVEAARRHNLPRLAVSTINKALGRMQATWKWADKQLDDQVPDIFGPMKLSTTNSPRQDADPFSPCQLQQIFNSPIYTGCRSERFRSQPGNTDMSGTSWFWLPLLGLWTGARLNELCQLRVEDIGEEGAIPFLRLHEGEETQRVKGHKSRNVPLHPELVRLGFLEYVDDIQRQGNGRVFPNLKLDAKGYYSDRASKDFNSYILALGIKTKKTSFHSFRHCFKDACRNAGVNPDINDILLGHALPGMSGRYGDGKVPLSRLYEAVCKVEYAGLSLQHIRGFVRCRQQSRREPL